MLQIEDSWSSCFDSSESEFSFKSLSLFYANFCGAAKVLGFGAMDSGFCAIKLGLGARLFATKPDAGYAITPLPKTLFYSGFG